MEENLEETVFVDNPIYQIQEVNNDLLIEEMQQLNKLNVRLIDNSIEYFKVSIIFFGVLVAILIGSLFVKMVYQDV